MSSQGSDIERNDTLFQARAAGAVPMRVLGWKSGVQHYRIEAGGVQDCHGVLMLATTTELGSCNATQSLGLDSSFSIEVDLQYSTEGSRPTLDLPLIMTYLDPAGPGWVRTL